MPAIWPPVKPRWAAAAVVAGSLVGLLASPVVKVVTIGFNDDDATTGSATFSHRCSVSEKTQHESVALGELDEQ